MPINQIPQPEMISIDDTLRLRKYSDNCPFALNWYQDEETLMLVDGVNAPYDLERLYRMYHYLQDRGEVYFIEYRENGGRLQAHRGCKFLAGGHAHRHRRYVPPGKGHRKPGGSRTGSARSGLGPPMLEVSEIFDYNKGSKRMFEQAGFRALRATEDGHAYRLEL